MTLEKNKDSMDFLLFSEDKEVKKEPVEKDTWKILIADDDEDVHTLTRLVLRGYKFENKNLEILSANSGEETIEIMRENPDIALILLDVVMEDYNTGFVVTNYIREELGNQTVRIVIRTGQPGQTPEKEVVQKYEVNDYRLKTDMTSGKLHTIVTTSLRSYRDLLKANSGCLGIPQDFSPSSDIYESQSLEIVATEILVRLSELLNLDDSSFYARAVGISSQWNTDDFYVIAATGEYEDKLCLPVKKAVSGELFPELEKVVKQEVCVFDDNMYICFFKSHNDVGNVVCLKTKEPLSQVNRELISFFFKNITKAFDNLHYFNCVINAEQSLINIMSEWGETGQNVEDTSHTKRVGKLSALMYSKLNLNPELINSIEMIAAIHDMGKLKVPASILEKPDKLSPEEYEMIKLHPEIGAKVLENSENHILRLAAKTIHQHHEKWDGTGYPLGLKGDEINILSRIIGLADVFDSMTHKRPYRKALTFEEAINYVKEQTGKHFDPRCVDIFLENIDDIIEIMNKYPE